MRDQKAATSIALCWLAVTAPLMVFPELIWPSGRFVAAAVALLSLMSAQRLLAAFRPFGHLSALLAVIALAAWVRVAGSKEALSHFCGLALGLVTMGTVASWCRTEKRLLAVVGLFLLAALGALVVGLVSTDFSVVKLVHIELPRYMPTIPIGLPGMAPSGLVNPDALGGTALLVTPMAAAVLWLPRRRFSGQLGLQLLGALTLAIAICAMALSQSRTVWTAAWLTFVVAGLWSWRGLRWRLLVLVAVVAVPVALFGPWRGRAGINRIVEDFHVALDERSGIWAEGLHQLRTSPWLGIGLNEFRHVVPPPPGETRAAPHVHNIILQTALDVGLAGLFVYVALVGWLLLRAAQTVRGPDTVLRSIAGGARLAIAGVHLFGIADAVPLGAKVGLFQWVASGLILAAWHMQSRASEASR